jgi:DNA-binding PadR family transcriptional regulator
MTKNLASKKTNDGLVSSKQTRRRNKSFVTLTPEGRNAIETISDEADNSNSVDNSNETTRHKRDSSSAEATNVSLRWLLGKQRERKNGTQSNMKCLACY